MLKTDGTQPVKYELEDHASCHGNKSWMFCLEAGFCVASMHKYWGYSKATGTGDSDPHSHCPRQEAPLEAINSQRRGPLSNQDAAAPFNILV